MGYLSYEDRVKFEIDDRALAHLQIVIADKLRRSEPFTFTWRDDLSVGGGRTTIWINSTSSLVFKYHGSRQPSVNRDWLEALAVAANSVGGLWLVKEPAAVMAEPVEPAPPAEPAKPVEPVEPLEPVEPVEPVA